MQQYGIVRRCQALLVWIGICLGRLDCKRCCKSAVIMIMAPFTVISVIPMYSKHEYKEFDERTLSLNFDTPCCINRYLLFLVLQLKSFYSMMWMGFVKGASVRVLYKAKQKPVSVDSQMKCSETCFFLLMTPPTHL